MEDQEKKAKQLMAEAEKKLIFTKGFFGSLFNFRSSRVDEAIELFHQAANKFKICKKWEEAGEAFTKAGELYFKGECIHDAASNFIDAANCYKKTDINKAVSCLERAIELYLELGRFHIAGKHHRTIAEILETNNTDLEKVIQHYEQAADYFQGEESNADARKVLLKVAMHSALLENYTKAIKIYEELAASSLQNSLLKYAASDYFFRASVCHLCIDVLNAQQTLNRYAEMNPAFEVSKEFKFLKTLTEAVEHEDIKSFTEAIQVYESTKRLDPWFTTLLFRIKKTLTSDDLC